jgi:hypothetical protein
MASRRELLLGVAASLSVAGCLGSGEPPSGQEQAKVIKTELDSDDTSENKGSDEQSTTTSNENSTTKPEQQSTDPLPGFKVHGIKLIYYKHLGLYTLLQIENTADSTEFEIKTEARDDTGLIADTDKWETVPQSLTRPIEVHMDDIWALRNNINNIASFVIKGRVEDGEYGVIRSFTGDLFQEKLASEEFSLQEEVASNDQSDEGSSKTEKSREEPEVSVSDSSG